MPVNVLLWEANFTPSALRWLITIILMLVKIPHRVFISANATPDKFITIGFMTFNIGLREVNIAETAPNRLIAMLLMLLQVQKRELKLAESAGSCATGATMRCSVSALDILMADRAVVVGTVI